MHKKPQKYPLLIKLFCSVKKLGTNTRTNYANFFAPFCVYNFYGCCTCSNDGLQKKKRSS